MGYLKDTVKGISWVAGLRGVTRAITFGRTALLARILTPSQFGVFGIVTIVLAFIEILAETGINIFLIQQKEKIDEYVDTAWIVSIIRGIIISLVIVLCSPFVATFFNSSEAYNLLLFSSLIPLIRGFINPSVVTFQKELQFRKEFWFRIVIFVVDTIVSVVLAVTTRSTTSLLWGLLIGAIVELVLSFFVVKPRPRLRFQSNIFKTVIVRGKWVTAAGIFNYLFHNADNVVVGKLLNVYSLGLYQQVYKISMLPITEVADVASKVTFPVYVKIAGDRTRLKTAFFKTIASTTVLTVPIGVIFFLFPGEIIEIILGPSWVSAASAFQVLSIFGVIRAISGSTSALFLAVEKQEFVSTVTFVSFFALAVTIVPLVMNLGIIGASLSVLFASIVVLPLMGYFVWKVLKK